MLRELRKKIFHIARDVAAITRDVRVQLESKGLQVDEEQLRGWAFNKGS